MNRVAMGLAALAATSVVVAGCGSSSSGGTPTPPSTANAGQSTSRVPGCDPSTIQTHTAGTLTFGVDKQLYAPWSNDNNDPLDGKGFESAVSVAIATELGYDSSHQATSRIGFNQAISPAPKSFDLDLDQFSITPAREKAVDFSAPYYDVVQSVVAVKGTPAASVTTLDGLKALHLGAQIGTTSAAAITADIEPHPALFQTNALAVQALKNGQIQGLVVDLPTAFYVTAVQVPNGVIVGQLPNAGGTAEQFGALLDKGSPVTSCVSKAIEALKSDGTLAKIQDKWLAQVGKAPVLQ